MDQEGKTRFSFAGIALSFIILIVLPLAITGVVISKGVVKVGEEATQANLRILDESQKQLIEGRAANIAEAIAQFFSEREKDIRIASILPRDVESYTTFLNSNVRGVVKASDVGIVKIPVPIYREIAFVDKEGMEILKVNADGPVPASELRNVAGVEGVQGEGYFDQAKTLPPGEFFMGPVTGRHVSKAEFDSGKRFDGIIRMAAPVFDSTGFAGVVELALNFVHVMEFTDHIIPTEAGKVYAAVQMEDKNYAFLVDREGYVLSHPADYLIKGFGENQQPVSDMDADNYEALLASGNGAMNVTKMGFLDENYPRMHALASEGKNGSFTYTLGNSRIFAAYAPIAFYGAGLSKPQGFGWVGMMVDIDRYHNLSQEKVKEIQQKVARWQKSSITVVIVSLILLFFIALILARGVYRQISAVQDDAAMTGPREDE